MDRRSPFHDPVIAVSPTTPTSVKTTRSVSVVIRTLYGTALDCGDIGYQEVQADKSKATVPINAMVLKNLERFMILSRCSSAGPVCASVESKLPQTARLLYT
jgi:hypothetical protein